MKDRESKFRTCRPRVRRRPAFAVKLCSRTKLHFLDLSGNVERNVKTIETFLEAEHGGHE